MPATCRPEIDISTWLPDIDPAATCTCTCWPSLLYSSPHAPHSWPQPPYACCDLAAQRSKPNLNLRICSRLRQASIDREKRVILDVKEVAKFSLPTRLLALLYLSSSSALRVERDVSVAEKETWCLVRQLERNAPHRRTRAVNVGLPAAG